MVLLLFVTRKWIVLKVLLEGFLVNLYNLCIHTRTPKKTLRTYTEALRRCGEKNPLTENRG